MFYELLYIVSGSLTDVEVQTVMKSIEALLLGAGATLTSHKSEGRLPLSYPIKKAKTGSYVLAFFEAPAASIEQIEKALRIDADLLRHLLLKSTKEQTKKTFEILPYTFPLAEQEERASSHAPERTYAAVPAKVVHSDISSEELDKKLDEILEDTDLDLKNV